MNAVLRRTLSALSLTATLLVGVFGLCAMPHEAFAQMDMGEALRGAADACGQCPLSSASHLEPWEKFSQIEIRDFDPLARLPQPDGQVSPPSVVGLWHEEDLALEPGLARSDGGVVSAPYLLEAFSRGILNPKKYPTT